MAHLDRSVASLRITGDDLLPEQVTQLLGCRPSHSFRKGERIAKGATAAQVTRFGYWGLNAPETSPADIDLQVSSILDMLADDPDSWNRLRGFKVDLFCGWFMQHLNEGLEISPSTMGNLAARGIKLSIDLYGPGD